MKQQTKVIAGLGLIGLLVAVAISQSRVLSEQNLPKGEILNATSSVPFITSSTPVIRTPSNTAKKEIKDKKEIKREMPGSISGTDITRENILNGVNQERYDAGLSVLKINDVLNAAAEAKLKDMIDKSYFSHISPDGSWVRDWIERSGYEYKYGGENLAGDWNEREERFDPAYSFHSIGELMDAWMNSPKHRENILKEQYTETGIAVSGSIVVQIFASPIK